MGLSREIRDSMAAKGVSQAELAATMGMSLSQLSRMLRDDDHNYTVKTLTRIAHALDEQLTIEFTNGDTALDPVEANDLWTFPSSSKIAITGRSFTSTAATDVGDTIA